MIASTRPDVNLRSFYEEEGINIDGLNLSEHDGREYASLLKLSHSRGVSGEGLSIPQGNENAVDINVCEDVTISGVFGTPGIEGDQVITAKGGSRRVHVVGEIASTSTRRKAHVQIGNWSDQRYGLCRDHVYDLKRTDGSGPVYVATGWVVPFSVKLRGDCRWLFWQSMELKAYVLAKLIVRTACRIPKGMKGPAWF